MEKLIEIIVSLLKETNDGLTRQCCFPEKTSTSSQTLFMLLTPRMLHNACPPKQVSNIFLRWFDLFSWTAENRTTSRKRLSVCLNPLLCFDDILWTLAFLSVLFTFDKLRTPKGFVIYSFKLFYPTFCVCVVAAFFYCSSHSIELLKNVALWRCGFYTPLFD